MRHQSREVDTKSLHSRNVIVSTSDFNSIALS